METGGTSRRSWDLTGLVRLVCLFCFFNGFCLFCLVKTHFFSRFIIIVVLLCGVAM